jgi:hypothetical protein
MRSFSTTVNRFSKKLTCRVRAKVRSVKVTYFNGCPTATGKNHMQHRKAGLVGVAKSLLALIGDLRPQVAALVLPANFSQNSQQERKAMQDAASIGKSQAFLNPPACRGD